MIGINVFLMLEGSEQSKCVPTKANIVRQLELRLALADQDDLVLVAFSGHGVLEGTTSYLCPCDCVLEKARETMVSMDDIYDRMKRCKAAQKILLVDISAGRKLHVSVTAPTARLQVGQEVQGTVVENQVLTIGLEEGDWLWVEEVNGDPKLRGYIQKSAVEKVAAARQSPSESAAEPASQPGQYRGATTGRAGYAQQRESPLAAARERRLERLEQQHDTAVEEGRFAKAKALETQLRPFYRAQDRPGAREEQGGGRRSR